RRRGAKGQHGAARDGEVRRRGLRDAPALRRGLGREWRAATVAAVLERGARDGVLRRGASAADRHAFPAVAEREPASEPLSAARRARRGTPMNAHRNSIALPGLVLGIGLGGFADGILLHQILQWHHMLSSTDTDNLGLPFYDPATVGGLRMNTLWDGLFH